MLLKTVSTVENPSVENLLDLWAQRYTPELSSLFLLEDPLNYDSLIDANSAEGRALTVSKLTDNLLDINSQMAWVQTKTLHNYIPNILDLNEARRITQFATRVYKRLLQVYQKQSNSLALPKVRPSETASFFARHSLLSLGKPILTQLAYELEPILLVFQEQLLASKDWRALGFMTTQLKFTNKLILSYLTPVENVLLSPYLKFVEEQVCVPWQRVCAAAATYELGSLALTVVQQMIPAAEEIAQTVHRRLVQLFPNYYSRSGLLTDSDVAHSSIRDMNMFQAYLWLCVLEQSLAPVEEELINLCVMVFGSIGVKWELAEKSIQLLVVEVLDRSMPEYKSILLPYIQGIQQIFFKACY
ncbi:hypothetical protein BZZ01_17745 [Nostocales cyanobacterium HT-58-2]|nr:hypothetical protein BZZ01_17745 [Nostocales cyanobacterium HT-58-2]